MSASDNVEFPARTNYPARELIDRAAEGRFVIDCSLEAFLEGLKGDAQAAHGAGGLGFLAGETYGAYKEVGVNAAGCIPGYGTVKKGDTFANVDWSSSGAVPLTDDGGQTIVCDIPMNGESYKAEFWVVEEGGTPVIMIRQSKIFHVRYPDDPAEKLKQYMFFGRAVVEMCKRLRINPSVLRINEAQLVPVMMAVSHHKEETRSEIGSLFRTTKMVFTNHTQERAALPSWANQTWVEDIIGKGIVPENAWSELPEYHPMVQSDLRQMFCEEHVREGEGGVKYYRYLSPLNYGLVVASVVNLVSREHGTISRGVIFPTQDPGQHLDPHIEAKLITITNGSDRKRWTSPALQGKQKEHVDAEGSIADVTGEELLAARAKTKEDLNAYLEANNLPTLEHVDGRPLIALTRRHVAYKEIGTLIPLVAWMCGDPDKEYEVPGGEKRKGLGANLLIGGVASDPEGREWKQKFEELQRIPSLQGKFVFAPQTGIEFMRLCTGSADFWIHGPRQTREACGTSYERAVFSGAWNICSATGGPIEHIQDGKNGSITDLFPDIEPKLVAEIFDGTHGKAAQEAFIHAFQYRWQQYLLTTLPSLVEQQKNPDRKADMAQRVYKTADTMGIVTMARTYRAMYEAVMDGTLTGKIADKTLKSAEPFSRPADISALLSKVLNSISKCNT